MIRAGTLADALDVAQRLRQADIAEIAAASGYAPADALRIGAEHSSDLRAWVLNGRVEAVSGMADRGGDGLGWMVGTDAIFTTAKWPFARLSRPEMDRLNRLWPRLVGYVHAANLAHVRWLKWCGFEVRAPVPWGVSGELFHPFVRLAHV